MTAYAAAQAAGISEESARRFRKGERPALSYKVRAALAQHLATLEPRPAVRETPPPSQADALAERRRAAVTDLLRVYRLRLWESAGQFALDVFDAAVEQQRAEVARALGEAPPHPADLIAPTLAEGREGTLIATPPPAGSVSRPAKKRRGGRAS
jgi:hypothetical protein